MHELLEYVKTVNSGEILLNEVAVQDYSNADNNSLVSQLTDDEVLIRLKTLKINFMKLKKKKNKTLKNET